MPDTNTANDVVFNERGAIEHLDTKTDKDMSKSAPSVDVHDEKKAEFATDLNHVAQLGFENAAELEKKVVRALDTWMMPQLWILYMFNYLNRYVLILHLDLNLCPYRPFNIDQLCEKDKHCSGTSQLLQPRSQSRRGRLSDRRCRPDRRLHASPTALEHAHHSRVS
jgi:hypothetical protein